MSSKKYIQASKSWKDLNITLSQLTKSNQSKLAGDIFEYLTKLYLETAPQYKSKLKKVYLLNEVPTTIKKKINLPDTDEGIDLVAVTNDDEYWAIQCKYRSDPNQTLTIKEDLATFNNLAFTYCKNISHAIVCATVSKPPKKIKLLKSIGFETLETWLALDDGDLFSQIKAKASGRIIKPKTLSPRPHQIAAIKQTKEHFKSNERGKIIMPCGTGKSLTAFWIAKEMGVKSILVAVPSLALLQQTLKIWTREFLINDIEPEWFCVCSDGTVKDEQDDYVTDTSDLGIKVETDPKQIKQFLKKKTSKIKVVFTTYQSGRATAKGSKGFTYDLGIMDEAHKTVGSKTKEMAHLLHQKNIRIKKRIFMTATERLFRGDSDEFMSMDDPRDYGSLIYELSFKQAINSKPPIISDYKIITFGITVPEIEEIYNSNKYLEVKKVLKDITARELATALALRKAIKKFKINNAISFHRSIRRADNFRTQQELITKIYPEYGKLKSFHVRGDMPTADRAVQMREFAKGKGLMTNARCLTEGVDLPAIDCVCFTDPKRSKVDIVQAAGRALRLSKGKKFGYILIPIFIPAGADFNEAAEEQGFDDVAITVRALATTDTRISEYLRVIAEGKKPRGGSPVEGLTSANSLLKIEAEEFDKAIKLKVWDKVAIGNWVSYEEAQNFAIKNNIKSTSEWNKFFLNNKVNRNIPRSPKNAYKNQWKSWGEFLKTGTIASIILSKNYVSYNEAKKIVRNLKIKSNTQYKKFHRNRRNFDELKIPRAPGQVYQEWEGWPLFLGIHKPSKKTKYFTYEEAKEFIKKFNFKKFDDYAKYIRRPNRDLRLPSRPMNRYKGKGWVNVAEFLGTKILYKGNYINYKNSEKFAHKLKLKYARDWSKLKLPLNIPLSPNIVYKNKGWVDWSTFLNTQIHGNKNLASLKEVTKFLVFNKVASYSQYNKLRENGKTPYNFPINLYKFLNNNNVNSIFSLTGVLPTKLSENDKKQLYNYEKLKEFISKIKEIDSQQSYYEYWKKNEVPIFVRKFPPRMKDWKGWDDFLNKKKQYLSYEEAKIKIKEFNFKGGREYFEYVRNNGEIKNIPRTVNQYYTIKKTWKGWPDFLGKKTNG